MEFFILEIIESVNGAVNRFIWGVPAMGGPGAVLHFQLLLAGAYMVQDV